MNTGKTNSIVLTEGPSRAAARCCTALALLLAAPCLFAQTPTSIPVPSQLTTANTILLVNAGSPINHTSQEAYIAVYQALLASKRFTLATKPADAELVLEISVPFAVNPLCLKLDIRDIKTQTLLWSISEPIGGNTSYITAVRPKYMLTAATDLVTDLNALASGSIAPQPTKK